MSRRNTNFVLGYHGCDRKLADRVIQSDPSMLQSDHGYDWLGAGVYFWERDPVRAWEWTCERAKRDAKLHPAVIGAIIDLGDCLDLTTREGVELIQQAYKSFISLRTKSDQPLPVNGPKRDATGTVMMRYLDHAVLNHLHSIAPFDSVRYVFLEGDDAYPGAGFRTKTHTQIAVRNPACIHGLFYPLINGIQQFPDQRLPDIL